MCPPGKNTGAYWPILVAIPFWAAAAAKSRQLCPTRCDPIGGSPPGSSVPGILQARILEWVPFPSPCIKVKRESEVAQSSLTLRDPMDCSLPGSSVHGILQARVLEWGAIAFSAHTLLEHYISCFPSHQPPRVPGAARTPAAQVVAPPLHWPSQEQTQSSGAASGANRSKRPTCRGGNKMTIETQGQCG